MRLRHFRLRRRNVFDVCWWNLELVRIDESRKKHWWPLEKVWNSCTEMRVVGLQISEFRQLPVVVAAIWDALIISQICKTGGKQVSYYWTHDDHIAWVLVSQLVWINIKIIRKKILPHSSLALRNRDAYEHISLRLRAGSIELRTSWF